MKNSLIPITAGRSRGKKILFQGDFVRPTPTRVRETLFQWLGHDLLQARVLDLFAGSGILGFEALSRGAASAVFCEQDVKTLKQLQQNALQFSPYNIQVLSKHISAAGVLDVVKSFGPFDVIFLDPPYESDLLLGVTKALCESGVLLPETLLYLESNNEQIWTDLQQYLVPQKQGKAGQALFGLFSLP